MSSPEELLVQNSSEHRREEPRATITDKVAVLSQKAKNQYTYSYHLDDYQKM